MAWAKLPADNPTPSDSTSPEPPTRGFFCFKGFRAARIPPQMPYKAFWRRKRTRTATPQPKAPTARAHPISRQIKSAWVAEVRFLSRFLSSDLTPASVISIAIAWLSWKELRTNSQIPATRMAAKQVTIKRPEIDK